MKVTKTSVHRLTVTKTCGCQATREYEDLRYTKPLGEGVFVACEKHEKNKAVAEFAGEILIENLDKEAEIAGKAPQFVSQRRDVQEGDNAGVQATSEAGGSTQAMGVVMPPKIRAKQDPLRGKTIAVDRPTGNRPQNTSTGSLNVAQHEDISPEELEAEGITMDGSIEGVDADPKVDAQLAKDFGTLEELFDDEDSRSGGVSQTLINRQAAD